MNESLLALLALILPFILQALSKALQGPSEPAATTTLAQGLAAHDAAVVAQAWALHDNVLQRAGVVPPRPPSPINIILPPLNEDAESRVDAIVARRLEGATTRPLLRRLPPRED